MSPALTSSEPSSSAFDCRDFTRFIDGWGTGTVSSSVSSGVWSLDAVAVLSIEPAVTSAAVTTYVAVHDSVSVGARKAGCVGVHVSTDRPGNGSLIETFVRFAVPVLVTTKL